MGSTNFFECKGKNFLNPTKVYELEYWIYVFTGCWEYKSSSYWKNVLYKLYRSVVAFLYTCMFVFFVVDATLVKDDLEKLSFNMASSFLVIVTVGKVGLFFKQRMKMEDVHRKLENNFFIKSIGDSKEDQNIFREKAEIITTLTTGFYSLMLLGLPLRIIEDVTITRAYLIPIPYIHNKDSYFNIIYATQTVIVCHFLVLVLAHDLLVYAVLIRFIAHYEILEKNFLKIKRIYPKKDFEKYVEGFKDCEEMGDIKDIPSKSTNQCEKVEKYLKNRLSERYRGLDRLENKERTEKKAFELLKENIAHHQILLRETTNFCRLYSAPLLVQACGVGFLIGIIILQIFFLSNKINVLLIEQIIYVGTLLWNIFHLCNFGTELMTKSNAAAKALYDTPWYEMGTNNRRIIQIAIKKMSEGPKFTGGGMIAIDRITYLKFLRISYNLIAVLRHIY